MDEGKTLSKSYLVEYKDSGNTIDEARKQQKRLKENIKHKGYLYSELDCDS